MTTSAAPPKAPSPWIESHSGDDDAKAIELGFSGLSLASTISGGGSRPPSLSVSSLSTTGDDVTQNSNKNAEGFVAGLGGSPPSPLSPVPRLQAKGAASQTAFGSRAQGNSYPSPIGKSSVRGSVNSTNSYAISPLIGESTGTKNVSRSKTISFLGGQMAPSVPLPESTSSNLDNEDSSTFVNFKTAESPSGEVGRDHLESQRTRSQSDSAEGTNHLSSFSSHVQVPSNSGHDSTALLHSRSFEHNESRERFHVDGSMNSVLGTISSYGSALLTERPSTLNSDQNIAVGHNSFTDGSFNQASLHREALRPGEENLSDPLKSGRPPLSNQRVNLFESQQLGPDGNNDTVSSVQNRLEGSQGRMGTSFSDGRNRGIDPSAHSDMNVAGTGFRNLPRAQLRHASSDSRLSLGDRVVSNDFHSLEQMNRRLTSRAATIGEQDAFYERMGGNDSRIFESNYDQHPDHFNDPRDERYGRLESSNGLSFGRVDMRTENGRGFNPSTQNSGNFMDHGGSHTGVPIPRQHPMQRRIGHHVGPHPSSDQVRHQLSDDASFISYAPPNLRTSDNRHGLNRVGPARDQSEGYFDGGLQHRIMDSPGHTLMNQAHRGHADGETRFGMQGERYHQPASDGMAHGDIRAYDVNADVPIDGRGSYDGHRPNGRGMQQLSPSLGVLERSAMGESGIGYSRSAHYDQPHGSGFSDHLQANNGLHSAMQVRPFQTHPEVQLDGHNGFQSNFHGRDVTSFSSGGDGSPVMASAEELKRLGVNVNELESYESGPSEDPNRQLLSMQSPQRQQFTNNLSHHDGISSNGLMFSGPTYSGNSNHVQGGLGAMPPAPQYHRPTYESDFTHPLAGGHIDDTVLGMGVGHGVGGNPRNVLQQQQLALHGHGRSGLMVSHNTGLSSSRLTSAQLSMDQMVSAGMLPHFGADSHRAQLTAGMGGVSMALTPRVVYTVKFKRTQRSFISGQRLPLEIKIGCYVKVEADRGEDLGIVVSRMSAEKFNTTGRSNFRLTSVTAGMGISPSSDMPATAGAGIPGAGGAADLKRIIRLATHDEVSLLAVKREEEDELLKICRNKVRQRGLPMNVVDAEYQFDRHKLTFFFEAEGRIDFRELVRDLFSIYKTRIWMQQLDKNVSGGVIAASSSSVGSSTIGNPDVDSNSIDVANGNDDDGGEASTASGGGDRESSLTGN